MIGNIDKLFATPIMSPDAKNAKMKVLISPEQGWQDHVMRLIEVDPGGYTPKHSHPWPHINFIVSGKGELMIAGEAQRVSAGSYAFVPQDTLHQFQNVGDDPFKFICIVPKDGHK